MMTLQELDDALKATEEYNACQEAWVAYDEAKDRYERARTALKQTSEWRERKKAKRARDSARGAWIRAFDAAEETPQRKALNKFLIEDNLVWNEKED